MTSEILDLTASSVANDPRFRSWWLRYSRLTMPRQAATTMYRWVTEIDIRLRAYRGHEVDHTGDGFLAIFDGPARAVTCAARMVDALRELGVTIRVGLHTGEIELVGDAIRGLAVHIAARVMSVAEDGGILVSATVKDLVLGSGIDFADRGTHRLKGVPGEWQLIEVISAP